MVQEAGVPEESGDAERRLREAWSALLEDADRIADGIAAATLGGDQGGAWSTPELRAMLRRSTREHVRRGLRGLAGVPSGEGAGGRLVDTWRATGVERARQGVPLETVISTYTSGNRLLWEELGRRVREGRLDITTEELLEAGRRLWEDLSVTGEVLSAAYRRETARLTLRDLRRQEDCLAGLLEGKGADPVYAEQAEEILGVRATAPLACVVALAEDPGSDVLHHPEDRMGRLGATSRWAVREGALYGVVEPPSTDEEWLTEALGPLVEGQVGVAWARQGIPETAAAFRLATRAAHTLPPGERRLAWASHRLPEVLLESSPEVAALLVEEVLGPLRALPADQRATLMETLRALLRRSGSATLAAEDLICHRNTVIYRTKRLVELTGCSLQDPRGRLMLELAVLAADRAGGPVRRARPISP